jgi:hypothetical protein
LNLCQFSASVWQINDKRALPPFSGASTTEITNKSNIVIGEMGALRPSGVRYNQLPNGGEFDITPKVAGNDFYKFTVSGQKYLSYFDVFVQQANPGLTFEPTSDTYDWGHAFWRLRTEAPDDALQSIPTYLRRFLNRPWGFYPSCNPAPSWTNNVTVPGFLQDDTGHSSNVVRHFYIGYNQLISGLTYTMVFSNSPPFWSGLSTNCVFACVGAARESGIFLQYSKFPQSFAIYTMLLYPPILSNDLFRDEEDIFYSSTQGH